MRDALVNPRQRKAKETVDETVLSLPFDSYERYALTAQVVSLLWPHHTRATPLRLLDVGGHSSSLKYFLPHDTVVAADIKEPPAFTYRESVPFRCDQYVRAAGGSLPFADKSFDLVAAHDTLEHVPEPNRLSFLRDLLRVSRRFVILHGPMYSRQTAKAERRLALFWREALGLEAHPLREHLEMGLPEREFVRQFLEDMEKPFVSIPNGNIVLWLTMMALKHYVIAFPDADEAHEVLDRTFNALLAPFDFAQPCYREAYVIANNRRDLPAVNRVSAAFKPEVNKDAPVYNVEAVDLLVGGLERHARNARKQMVELRSRVDRLTDSVIAKDALISSKDATISLRESTLAEQENVLVQKEAEIAHQKEKIAEKDDAIRKRDAAIADKELRLGAALTQLDAITNRIGYRFLEALRRMIARLAPMGTRRRNVIIVFGRGVDILMTHGWRRFLRSFLSFWRWIPRLFRPSSRVRMELSGEPAELDPLDAEYQLWLHANELTAEQRQAMKKEAALLGYRPTISVVVPVYNTDPRWLTDCIESVRSQIYDDWELCLADDGSSRRQTKRLLRKYRRRDRRIKVKFLKSNQGIVAASNAALALATGDFVGLLDHDDELKPDALLEVVKLLSKDMDLDYIYSDEDKKDIDGRLVEPFFKPDWSPDLLQTINYVTHFSVYRRRLIHEVGGFREGFDGSQDYDLVLRVAELTDGIAHLAKPLYTWRKAPGSAASKADAKPFAFNAAKRALRDSLRRRSISGDVSDGLWLGSYRVRYSIVGKPLVGIIIPTRDRVDLLASCVESIKQQSTYSNYEFVVVDNQSREPETLRYLQELEAPVIRFADRFNFAKIVNLAARETTADVLLLVNNDTEVLTPRWIESMLEHAQRTSVAAVGARLLYPDGRPQHEGIILGLGRGSAINIDHQGYFGLGQTIRNCSAVTGACMMIRREVFWELGGFEERLGVAFNDVDFCLRAREKGYQIVYTPYAVLRHHESATRGRLHPEEDELFFRARWGNPGDYPDPYYNPNLDPEKPFHLRLPTSITAE
jgi:GT2 family glycosyltransferase